MEDQKVLKAFIDNSIRDSVQQMKDSISKDLAELRSVLLEVMGKKAMTSFQPRDTAMDAKLWWFRGENPEDWIFQAECYFDFYKIKDDQKLTRALFYLDGDTLEWYQSLYRNKQLIDWPHFADKVRTRFKQKGLKSEGKLAKRSCMTNSSFLQNYGRQCDCKNKIHAHKVFDESSDRSKGAYSLVLSHVPNSSDLESTSQGRNLEAANIIDKMSNGADDSDLLELSSSVTSFEIQDGLDSVEIDLKAHTDSETTTLTNFEDTVFLKVPQGTGSSQRLQFAPDESLPAPFDGSLLLPSNVEQPTAHVLFHEIKSALEEENTSHVNKMFAEMPYG
ncbi:hypothetical protein A4A49_01868 [Nicotiana attenuata]|uniref:Retrotransposon gag domain-containing protein n=1 Tax=Nicotiana attenuata TaxID=49451 RepID=A0A1J6I7U6_NICAT|nr:hypothetical protein A4A49_01868 [Nicotiana attenuata]